MLAYVSISQATHPWMRACLQKPFLLANTSSVLPLPSLTLRISLAPPTTITTAWPLGLLKMWEMFSGEAALTPVIFRNGSKKSATSYLNKLLFVLSCAQSSFSQAWNSAELFEGQKVEGDSREQIILHVQPRSAKNTKSSKAHSTMWMVSQQVVPGWVQVRCFDHLHWKIVHQPLPQY